MVFRDILGTIGKRKIYSFLLGIIYVLISYGTSVLFFHSYISLAMIFFITLLLMPSSLRLINIEEKIERKEGLHRFLSNHYVLIEIFLFLFIGIFIGYLIVGSYDNSALSYQNSFLDKVGVNLIDNNIEKTSQLTGIFLNNVSVIVVSFVLSFFYGIGALFLTVLNASIFAGYILKFAQLLSAQKVAGVSLFSLHFIPEVLGFLMAAIAGGVISRAIAKEKIGSFNFRNVVKDSSVLLLLSIVVILVAALIETFVTPQLLSWFL